MFPWELLQYLRDHSCKYHQLQFTYPGMGICWGYTYLELTSRAQKTSFVLLKKSHPTFTFHLHCAHRQPRSEPLPNPIVRRQARPFSTKFRSINTALAVTSSTQDCFKYFLQCSFYSTQLYMHCMQQDIHFNCSIRRYLTRKHGSIRIRNPRFVHG